MTFSPTEWLSDCGRFEITRQTHRDYLLQYLKRMNKSIIERKHLGTFDTFEAAVKAAEEREV